MQSEKKTLHFHLRLVLLAILCVASTASWSVSGASTSTCDTLWQVTRKDDKTEILSCEVSLEEKTSNRYKIIYKMILYELPTDKEVLIYFSRNSASHPLLLSASRTESIARSS